MFLKRRVCLCLCPCLGLWAHLLLWRQRLSRLLVSSDFRNAFMVVAEKRTQRRVSSTVWSSMSWICQYFLLDVDLELKISFQEKLTYYGDDIGSTASSCPNSRTFISTKLLPRNPSVNSTGGHIVLTVIPAPSSPAPPALIVPKPPTVPASPASPPKIEAPQPASLPAPPMSPPSVEALEPAG